MAGVLHRKGFFLSVFVYVAVFTVPLLAITIDKPFLHLPFHNSINSNIGTDANGGGAVTIHGAPSLQSVDSRRAVCFNNKQADGYDAKMSAAYLEISNLRTLSEVTMSVWLHTDFSYNMTALSIADTLGLTSSLSLHAHVRATPSCGVMEVSADAGKYVSPSQKSCLGSNTWEQWVVSISSSKLYLFGVESNTVVDQGRVGVVNPAIAQHAKTIFVAGDSAGTRGFNGCLSDLRIYSQAFVAAQATSVDPAWPIVLTSPPWNCAFKVPTSSGGFVEDKGPFVWFTGIAINALTPQCEFPAFEFNISPALSGGLTLDTFTGVISGTPTDKMASTTTYTLTPTNAYGLGGTFTFSFKVMDTNYFTCADKVALLDFFVGTNGHKWKTKTGWGSTANCCTWYRVTCSTSSQVTQLKQYSLKLSGALRPSIGLLTELQVLQLYSNSITGALPEELSLLVKLNDMNLYNNLFSGPLPGSFGNLLALKSLLLNNNNLSGPIPSNIGSMKSLVTLKLGINRFSSSIPDSLGLLTNLAVLRLENNQLIGELPLSIASLSLLKDVNLSGNVLSGDLSSVITVLSGCASLTTLALTNNNFGGTIPASVAKLKSLVSLTLTDNNLQGIINTAVFSLLNLNMLDLSKNELVGELSPLVCNLQNLYGLYLSKNQLSGMLPQCLQALPNLTTFDISFNYFSGSYMTQGFAASFLTCQMQMNRFQFGCPGSSVIPEDFRWMELSCKVKSDCASRLIPPRPVGVKAIFDLSTNTFRVVWESGFADGQLDGFAVWFIRAVSSVDIINYGTSGTPKALACKEGGDSPYLKVIKKVNVCTTVQSDTGYVLNATMPYQFAVAPANDALDAVGVCDRILMDVGVAAYACSWSTRTPVVRSGSVAAAPVNVTISPNALDLLTSLSVAWTPGRNSPCSATAYECHFSSWAIFHRGAEVNVPESANLTSRAVTAATVYGLSAGSTYQFEVVEGCTCDGQVGFSSDRSLPSSIVGTVVKAGVPVVQFFPPAPDAAPAVFLVNSVIVQWNAASACSIAGCSFRSWNVIRNQVGADGPSTTEVVEACVGADLTVHNRTSCLIAGLAASTNYTFSVENVCTCTQASSVGIGRYTTATAAVPVNAALTTVGVSSSLGPSFNLTRNPSAPTSSIIVGWAAPAAPCASDVNIGFACAFAKWTVAVAAAPSSSASPPSSPLVWSAATCSNSNALMSRSTTVCTVTLLPAGSFFFFKVTEECLPASVAAASGASVAASVCAALSATSASSSAAVATGKIDGTDACASGHGFLCSSSVALAQGSTCTTYGDTCVACPRGKFGRESRCVDCPPGLSTWTEGASDSSSCVSCPPGMFPNNDLKCQACAEGLYSPFPGRDCIRCPDSATSTANRTACICKADFFMTSLSHAAAAMIPSNATASFVDGGKGKAYGLCAPCPSSAICKSPATEWNIQAKQSFFPPSSLKPLELASRTVRFSFHLHGHQSYTHALLADALTKEAMGPGPAVVLDPIVAVALVNSRLGLALDTQGQGDSLFGARGSLETEVIGYFSHLGTLNNLSFSTSQIFLDDVTLNDTSARATLMAVQTKDTTAVQQAHSFLSGSLNAQLSILPPPLGSTGFANAQQIIDGLNRLLTPPSSLSSSSFSSQAVGVPAPLSFSLLAPVGTPSTPAELSLVGVSQLVVDASSVSRFPVTAFVRCPNTDACVGSGKCATGYTGALCGQCSSGFGRFAALGTFSCVPCPPLGPNLLATAGGILALTVGLYVVIRLGLYKSHQNEEELLNIIRVVEELESKAADKRIDFVALNASMPDLQLPLSFTSASHRQLAEEEEAKAAKAAQTEDSLFYSGAILLKLTDFADKAMVALFAKMSLPGQAGAGAGLHDVDTSAREGGDGGDGGGGKNGGGGDEGRLEEKDRMGEATVQRAVGGAPDQCQGGNRHLYARMRSLYDVGKKYYSPPNYVSLLKLIISHMQVMSIAMQFNFQWPALLAPLLFYSAKGSSATSNVANFDCFVSSVASIPYVYFSSFVILVVIPFFMTAVVMLVKTCQFRDEEATLLQTHSDAHTHNGGRGSPSIPWEARVLALTMAVPRETGHMTVNMVHSWDVEDGDNAQLAAGGTGRWNEEGVEEKGEEGGKEGQEEMEDGSDRRVEVDEDEAFSPSEHFYVLDDRQRGSSVAEEVQLAVMAERRTGDKGSPGRSSENVDMRFSVSAGGEGAESSTSQDEKSAVPKSLASSSISSASSGRAATLAAASGDVEAQVLAVRTKHASEGINILINLYTLLYPDLVKTAFGLFQCVEAGDSSGSNLLLAADTSINCRSSYHMLWQGALGIPTVALYAFVGPLVLVYALYCHLDVIQYSPTIKCLDRQKIKEKAATEVRLAFLCSPYKTGAYFWIAVKSFQKLGLIMITTFLSGRLFFQVALANMLFIFAIVLHVRYQPMTDPVLNLCEEFSLLSNASFYALGLLFFVPAIEGNAEAALMQGVSVTILAIFCMFVGLCLYGFYEEYQRMVLFNHTKSTEEEDKAARRRSFDAAMKIH